MLVSVSRDRVMAARQAEEEASQDTRSAFCSARNLKEKYMNT